MHPHAFLTIFVFFGGARRRSAVGRPCDPVDFGFTQFQEGQTWNGGYNVHVPLSYHLILGGLINFVFMAWNCILCFHVKERSNQKQWQKREKLNDRRTRCPAALVRKNEGYKLENQPTIIVKVQGGQAVGRPSVGRRSAVWPMWFLQSHFSTGEICHGGYTLYCPHANVELLVVFPWSKFFSSVDLLSCQRPAQEGRTQKQ